MESTNRGVDVGGGQLISPEVLERLTPMEKAEIEKWSHMVAVGSTCGLIFCCCTCGVSCLPMICCSKVVTDKLVAAQTRITKEESEKSLKAQEMQRGAETKLVKTEDALKEATHKFHIAALQMKFMDADLDGDGVLSPEEIIRAMSKIDPTIPPLEIQTWIDAADKNHDGYIDAEEFAAAKTTITLAVEEEAKPSSVAQGAQGILQS